MWHASVATRGAIPIISMLRQRAHAALARVGAAELGEWEEWTGRAFHLRRRLSPEEQRAVGDVVDIRGTAEARARLVPVAHLLPPGWTE